MIHVKWGKGQILFERATLKNLDDVFEIEKLAETHSPFTKEEMRECLESEHVYMIRVGKECVGYISYEIKNANEAFISSLCVKPEFQGRGLGRMLLDKTFEELTAFVCV